MSFFNINTIFFNLAPHNDDFNITQALNLNNVKFYIGYYANNQIPQ